ncbi:hypothetical protein CJF24_18650 [Aeromonas veronii]|uniref:Uncharacterized protein n=2 Tax=Aeromonas veronii TaxID=654 RepID=A0ABY3MHD7_AERVE|nr:hypothetical protein CJF24_18650 [Aeromonas veronii]
MGADLARWYDTFTLMIDFQNRETLAYSRIWYEYLLLANNTHSSITSHLTQMRREITQMRRQITLDEI